MKGKGTLVDVLGLLVFAVSLMSACSSKSPYNLYVEKIVGATGDNDGKAYLECDLIGSKTYPCGSIIDPVEVTIRAEKPGTLGPDLVCYVTGYTVDYFYYDPADGMIKGPVSGLEMSTENLHVNTTSGSATLTIPLVTFHVKAWSTGVSCDNVTGFGGGANVNRIVARVTIRAEDSTGKSLSAQGSILVIMDDYAPSPQSPASNADPLFSGCYQQSALTYWSTRCP